MYFTNLRIYAKSPVKVLTLSFTNLYINIYCSNESPLLWIRADPEMEYLAEIHFNQPVQMWVRMSFWLYMALIMRMIHVF